MEENNRIYAQFCVCVKIKILFSHFILVCGVYVYICNLLCLHNNKIIEI